MKKRPTLVDVARLANVSKSTAARVVNGASQGVRKETRDRVMGAVEKLGYERNVLAGSLRSEHTYIIAVSIPDITNSFWPQVVRGIQNTVEQEGYDVVLMNNDWDGKREVEHIRHIRQKQFDGLIIRPSSAQNTDLLKLDVPVVLLDSGEAFPDFDTVNSDSVQGVRLAIEHLVDLGHRRIGLIAGPSQPRKPHTHRDTYMREIKSHRLHLDTSLIIETDLTTIGGYNAMQKLLALRQRPTAIFAINDVLALGALRAAQSAGVRVPEQLSLIGMDDIFAAETTSPPLTTIAKPRYDIGTMAARFLLERIAKKPIAGARHPLIPCTLLQRNSTRAPS
jgi:LacI family transcriptional regulator